MHAVSLPQQGKKKRRVPPELVIPSTPEGYRPSVALAHALSHLDSHHARRSPTTPEIIMKHLHNSRQKAHGRLERAVQEQTPADRGKAARGTHPVLCCLRRPDRSPGAASAAHRKIHFVANPGADVDRQPTPRPTMDAAIAARAAANRRSRIRERCKLQATSMAQTSSADESWRAEGVPHHL